jgi:FMN phosphatase YigB (HAD superfamily)
MMRKMNDIEVVSFDVDGTIVDGRFMDGFWNEFIPKVYSKTHGVDYNTALKVVTEDTERSETGMSGGTYPNTGLRDSTSSWISKRSCSNTGMV